MARSQCTLTIDASGRDLHKDAARFRNQGPVARVLLPGDIQGWVVTDLGLIKQLLLDPRISKDAHRHWPAWAGGQVDESWPMSMWVSVRNMLTAYGAEHARLRRLVAGAFTARRTAALRPVVTTAVGQLLDGLAEKSGQVLDLRQEFACQVPARVISALLGLPESVHDDLLRVVGTLFRTTATQEEAQANQRELYGLLTELIAEKRASPGADLTSDLIAARDSEDGAGLSEKELLDTLLLVIGAGLETTVNLIDHATHALLSHPGQLTLVRDGSATWSDVIDETLRQQAVVANIPFRFATEDITLDGVFFPAGDPILLSLAAAGRDPRVHGPDADGFDVTRATRRDHIPFGHGVHHCPGRPLARMEATIALEELFRRFPDLALAVPADEVPPLESFISCGHAELPVRLGRESQAGSDACATPGMRGS
ncbi:cytochrome P450 family protein [Streptomyces sp. CA-250714]|uniref:cytochrome P450 family protein n=1 Tax=Streptomyces sp. CA-250714 TaxID=3240060 RepID=UPI003D922701